jgi:hypothetical protein
MSPGGHPSRVAARPIDTIATHAFVRVWAPAGVAIFAQA